MSIFTVFYSLVNGHCSHIAFAKVAFAYRAKYRSVIFHMKVNHRLNLAVQTPQGRFRADFYRIVFFGWLSVLIDFTSSNSSGLIAMITISVGLTMLFDHFFFVLFFICFFYVSDSIVFDRVSVFSLRSNIHRLSVWGAFAFFFFLNFEAKVLLLILFRILIRLQLSTSTPCLSMRYKFIHHTYYSTYLYRTIAIDFREGIFIFHE